MNWHLKYICRGWQYGLVAKVLLEHKCEDSDSNLCTHVNNTARLPLPGTSTAAEKGGEAGPRGSLHGQASRNGELPFRDSDEVEDRDRENRHPSLASVCTFMGTVHTHTRVKLF